MKTVIIGGVAGGATAAARLRRLDEKAEIIILERGEYVSFANCGLPYYIGGVITDREDLTLQTPESFKARFNIDVRVLNEAAKINPDTKTVNIKNLRTGETYEEAYDNLILSMGAEPIRPNIEGADGSNIFTLRNIPDTLKIKNYIDTAKPRLKYRRRVHGKFIDKGVIKWQNEDKTVKALYGNARTDVGRGELLSATMKKACPRPKASLRIPRPSVLRNWQN